MLNDILTLDQQWLPNQSDFPPISWPWHRLWPSPNYEWFPWSICNGCGMLAGNAYPSGHLVPSPYWDLLMLQLLRPNSSNLPCLYSTFHLEYPLVLSRFCFEWNFRHFLESKSWHEIKTWTFVSSLGFMILKTNSCRDFDSSKYRL